MLYAEILELRKKMWQNVASRQHTVEAIFPSKAEMGEGRMELMVRGKVRRTPKDGSEDMVGEFAAYVRLREERTAGDGFEMEEYKVYLVGLFSSLHL